MDGPILGIPLVVVVFVVPLAVSLLKGRYGLVLLGFVFPILPWWIGALIEARPSSPWANERDYREFRRTVTEQEPDQPDVQRKKLDVRDEAPEPSPSSELVALGTHSDAASRLRAESEARDMTMHRLPSFPEREQQFKRCSDCAEQVLFEARVCKHCGFRFEHSLQPDRPEQKPTAAATGQARNAVILCLKREPTDVSEVSRSYSEAIEAYDGSIPDDDWLGADAFVRLLTELEEYGLIQTVVTGGLFRRNYCLALTEAGAREKEKLQVLATKKAKNRAVGEVAPPSHDHLSRA